MYTILDKWFNKHILYIQYIYSIQYVSVSLLSANSLCFEELGMGNEKIADEQIKASSYFSPSVKPQFAR